jgi:cytochrome c peroxidase
MAINKTTRDVLLAISLIWLTAILAACQFTTLATTTPSTEPQIRVVVDGLLNPVGMARLPDGGLLVAEEGTGKRDDSAGVSLITPDGRIGRLISGFSSSRDSGDLAGVNLVVLSPAGDQVYIGHFNDQQLWTLPLSPEEQAGGLSLPQTALTVDQLSPAMTRLNNVYLTNPFDLTFDAAGTPVVSDASGNGVAKANDDGTTRFIHRFARLPNLATETESDSIDPVPTGITRVGEEYYVTLTGGCPYPQGGGQLVAIDENRNQRTILSDLNMPVDVAQGPDGTIWVLELARFTPGASCFDGSGYQARTGRLSRLTPAGDLEPVLTELNFPAAVLPLPDGSLYLSEVFAGRILHVTFGRSDVGPRPENAIKAKPTHPEPLSRRTEEASRSLAPKDYDQALQTVIQAHNLQPHPGADLREGDTQLARLGQDLFFDPIMSGDQNVACATCHHPAFAMADGRVLPIGSGGEGLGPGRTFVEQIVLGPEASFSRRLAGITDAQAGKTTAHNPFVGVFIPRNSQSVINSALFPGQFWDSRVENYAGQVRTQEDVVNDFGLTDVLAAQALFPVTSMHEMAGSTLGGLPPQAIRAILVERLRAIPAYVARFQQVFGPGDRHGSREEAITPVHVAEAVAAFERRFIFTDAPWDDYMTGRLDALTEEQKRGALLFFGQLNPAVNCAQCHSGDLFSDFQHYNLLLPQLGPGKGHGYSGREDWGRAGVTFDFRDRYAFRTPSLRNVSLTPPYFHSGAFASLAEAIRHHANLWDSARNYDPSAHEIPPALYSSLRPFEAEKQGQTVAPELADGLPLTSTDVADLVAFLESLTDPAARDLSSFVPSRVPSGLPLDPLPDLNMLAKAEKRSTVVTVAAEDRMEDSSGIAGLQLRDVAREVGLDFRHSVFQTGIFKDPVAMMGAGLCWLDYDNDGWLDLYLVNSYAEAEEAYWRARGGLPRNALYRNNGGVFTDVSAETKTDLSLRGNGCVAADFNNDGWWDLYVTADGPNALLWNKGDGTFVEGGVAAGVAAPEWNSAAVVGDLNQDGRPDLFVAAYIDLEHKIPKPSGAFPQDYYGLPDRLYLNLGPSPGQKWPAFREVTEPAGLVREERGLGALLSDLDEDGDLDLYIANDGHPNRLYANEPWPGGPTEDPAGLGFRLVDLTETADAGDSGSGMGVAGGDYDGDGWPDLFVTNWEREVNALYRNEIAEEGHLTFQYSTYRIGISGMGNGMTGWGTAWADFDHDTDLDLLVVNGRVPVTNLEADSQLVRFYRNRNYNLAGDKGRPGQFVEWTEQVGLKDVGPLMARGSAVADYDNDGDLDIAINTIAHPAVLLQNEDNRGNWLQVQLDGFQPGAKAVVTLPDGRRLVREVHAGSSYLASEDPRLHFGLGRAKQVQRLRVVLPDGRQFSFEGVPANQIIAVQAEASMAKHN